MRKEIIDYIKEHGHEYDTEGTAYFFYSLVKFKHTKNFLELGTGLGVTAFAVAEAMEENKNGRIITVDNSRNVFLQKKVKEFNLNKIDLINKDISFKEIPLINYDIIFSDFDRTPLYLQDLITFFLLNSNLYSSLFIDGLNSYWPGYSYISKMISLLKENKIPKIFRDTLNEIEQQKLIYKVKNTKFTQLDIRKRHNEKLQTGLTWLKLEPYNVCPEPLME